MPKETCHKPIKAIKWAFFIALSTLFLPLLASASFWTDNFDSYIPGYQLNDYPNWSGNDNWLIADTGCFSGNCVIGLGSTTTDTYIVSPANATSGSFSIEVNFSSAYVPRHITLRTADTQYPIWFYFQSATTTGPANMNAPPNANVFTDLALNEWHKISVAWQCNGTSTFPKIRFQLEQGAWTAWLDASNSYYCGDSEPITYTEFDFPQDPAEGTFAFDEFNSFNICSTFVSESECTNFGCVWYFNEWLFANGFTPYAFCVEALSVQGECGSDWNTCQYCADQTTCEAEDFCYWFQNRCQYGSGACGEGLQTQLCTNQTDCENAGGYWYESFCWLSAKPSLFDFDDYYAEHGDYATPSAWIASVASNTTGFFEQVGGFLATFREDFNLKDAYEKGYLLGSAIPIARGYLGIIDSFTAGLPFGEFLVFVMFLTLAVGVFRIVRNLIQLLKFW